jgi:hypothetical protein
MTTDPPIDPPPGRGPRFGFPDGELVAWAALGAVTDRSVRVWARRPGGPVPVTLTVEGEAVASSTLHPDPKHDGVDAVDLSVDPPRPGVPFEVDVDGQVRRGRFAPAVGTPTSFSFAFGSCHQPFGDPLFDQRLERHGGAAIYPRLSELIRERGSDFLLLLGDQVYSDAVTRISVREALAQDDSLTDEDLIETYRHLYRGYFNEAGFRALQETVPSYVMWDDHDIFDGWGSLLRSTDFDRRLFGAAATAFREYQHLRNPGGRVDAPAPYAYSFWYGDAGFFVLDLRGERDFETGRILGDTQWARLDAFLADASDREVGTVFIGASVPVVHAPRRQVVILSGDVHVAAAFSVRPKRGAGLRADRGRLAQWTSSALSTPGGLQHVLANRLVTSLVRLGERELRVWRRGLATGNNVGFVEVRPIDGGGHDLRFTVFQHDQRRDRLRAAFSDRSAPDEGR